MRVALDATYSVDEHPTGIAVYSQRLLDGLATDHPDDLFFHCYRARQFLKASPTAHSNVRRRPLLAGVPTFRAGVFHALNQRVDRRPARHVVSTFHDLFVMTGEYSSADFRARFTRQAREAAERSDLIIAVSKFTANQVSSLLKVERSRIRVVPHGVSVKPVMRDRTRKPIILFVGALQIRKNVARLVEAFESIPEPWKLVLAGASGYRADEVLQRIAASPARNRIDVTGYISQQRLDELYGEASVFAFPSLDEGFGMPVLEAMAWGVPVVTSAGSALGEIAAGAALLVDPLDVEAIRGALCRLTEEDGLRRELIAAGNSRVLRFSWERAVKETYAVYREMAG